MTSRSALGFALALIVAHGEALAIVRGTVDPGDPAVVWLGELGATGNCSGVVISSYVVLTRADCLNAPVNFGPSRDEVLATITSSRLDVSGLIGAIRLRQPAPVMPIVPNAIDLLPYVGQPVRLVGYGKTTELQNDSGVKRQGTATLVAVTADELVLDFDESAPCYGDEGGPILMTIDGVERVIGLMSIWSGSCGVAESHGLRIDVVHDWLMNFVDANEPSDPPSVSIVSPRDGDPVDPIFEVLVDATDDRGVKRVELWVDGVMHDVATAPPFSLTALPTVALGLHSVEVRAFDAAEQGAQAAITVVRGTPCQSDADCEAGDQCGPGFCNLGLGSTCERHEECASGLCGAVRGFRQCTQSCGDGAGSCPSGFHCQPSTIPGAGGQCEPGGGGCTTTPRRPNFPSLLLAVVLATLARARRRVRSLRRPPTARRLAPAVHARFSTQADSGGPPRLRTDKLAWPWLNQLLRWTRARMRASLVASSPRR